MPFNGSGTFSIVNTFVPGTTILSSAVNQNFTDIATNGLSYAVLKNGTQTLTANLPMSNFKLTGLGAGTTAGDSVRFEQVGTLSGTNTWSGTNSFTAAPNVTLTAAGTAMSFISTDAGATSGPDLELYRNSASPAASDVLSTLYWYGKDSATNKQAYFTDYVTILDPTSTTEDSNRIWKAPIAGADTIIGTFGPGFQIGTAPTGGDKGLGTSNSAVADYVAGRPYSPISIANANFTLTGTVGASALTIALKGLNGSDPSATNPVFVPFRSATAATGDSTDITLTAATSLVVSSGSTLGTTNSTAFRLWIVGFNDAGTFRLGVVNTLSGTNIMALSDGLLLSSTAEGGAGAADSAQVIYTGTAVTTKALRLLGYMDWSSGLGTAGTWSAGPTMIQLFGPGNKKPGDVVQTVRTATGAVATGTTTVPNDDTIPQNTEGDQYMSQAISPTAACNILAVEVQGIFASNTASCFFGVALFNATYAANDALVAGQIFSPGTNTSFQANLFYEVLAATASGTTFNVRGGGNSAGTFTFNGLNAGRKYGGVMNSFIKIRELMA